MNSKTLTIAFAVALLAVTAGYAQTKLIADIPFEFAVGQKVLPAGEYTVNPSAVPGTLLISGQNAGVFSVTIPSSTNSGTVPGSKLVFNRYGNTYFLSQVWNAGIQRGYRLPKSKAEREMARNAAGMELASVPATLR
jgi:hypothetical protein